MSCIVGRPGKKRDIAKWLLKEAYVDDAEMRLKLDLLKLNSPITNGIVTNWEDMESMWHYTFFNELRVEPRDHPVLITEPSMNPKDNREKMTEMMFEKFEIPAMYVSNQSVMSFFAGGLTTGIFFHPRFGYLHLL